MPLKGPRRSLPKRQQKAEAVKRVRRKQIRCLVFISFGFLLVCVACGRKGPPVVPWALVPPPVADLEASGVGHDVQLAWSIPERGDAGFEGIEGFKVYGSNALDLEAPCPGCPIAFSERLDVRLTDPAPMEVDDGRVVCHVKVTPGHRYAFKVVAYDESGGESKDSNVVQVAVE